MSVRAAVGAVDITPPKGSAVQGWDILRTAKTIHRSLKGKVLVLEDGTNRAGLVTLDLFGLEAPWVARIRQRLESRTGIPAAHWMVATSHIHSSPTVTHLSLPAGSKPDVAYLEGVTLALEDAAERAVAAVTPVRIGWGSGEVAFPINRRFVTQGRVAWPPMANADGPVDREVGVVRIDRRDGQPLAVLMNCTCHASILGTAEAISPDYPGVAQELVEEVLGEGVVAQFLLGCCGNVRANFTLPSGRFDWQAGEEQVETAGRELAKEVTRIWKEIEPQPAEDLRVASSRHSLPFADWRGLSLPRVEAEFQGLRAGELLILSYPGEVFAEIGLGVKRQLGQPPLMATCANGYVGYIPTAEAYPLEGYEVHGWFQWWGYPGPFHPVVGDLFREEAVQMATSLGVPARRDGQC